MPQGVIRQVPGWPPVTDREVAPAAAPEFRTALHAMNEATRRVRNSFLVLYAFRELQRPDVVGAVNARGPAVGTEVVIQALLRDLVVSTSALYDQNVRAIHVGRILKTLMKPEHRAPLAAFHRTWAVAPDLTREMQLLSARCKRLRRGPVAQALDRLQDHRHQMVAHFDLEPEYPRGFPYIRDIPVVLSATAFVLHKAQFIMLGRDLDMVGMRRRAREYAGSFADTVRLGSSAA